MADHLSIKRQADGKFIGSSDASESSFTCKWISCSRTQHLTRPQDISVHIRSHIPESEQAMTKLINDLSVIPPPPFVGSRSILHNSARSVGQGDQHTRHKFYYTAADERGQPMGIPFMSVMILRNLARFIGHYGGHAGLNASTLAPSQDDPTQNDQEAKNGAEAMTEVEKRQDLMSRMFSVEMRKHLWHVISVHRTMLPLLSELMSLIERGERAEKKRYRYDSDDENEDENNENGEVEARGYNSINGDASPGIDENQDAAMTGFESSHVPLRTPVA